MARKSNASLPLLKSQVSVSVNSVPSRIAVGVTVRKPCRIALVSVPGTLAAPSAADANRVDRRSDEVGQVGIRNGQRAAIGQARIGFGQR